MLKRPITYTNPFTEQEVTETHYFHISKADLIKMELEEHGDEYEKDGKTLTGMHAKLQRITDSEDGKAIMHEFEGMIRRAYGKKEGEKFLKSPEISDEFMASEAYSQLFFELCTQADAGAEFINGVIPGNLDEIAEDIRKQAELRAKGIEAQNAAKAAAATPEGDTATDPAAIPDGSERENEIRNATAENPVTLTRAEMVEMDTEVLKTGIAEGRFQLA